MKVDVGRFDRNTDIAASYGVPLKNGIPAVVVISPQGEPIYATRAGELADARSMGLPYFRVRPQAAITALRLSRPKADIRLASVHSLTRS